MTRYFIVFVGLVFTNFAIANNSEWTLTKLVDPMTDKTTCSIAPNVSQWNKALKASYNYFPLIKVDSKKISLNGITKGTHTLLSLVEGNHMLRIDKNGVYKVLAFVFKRKKEYSLLIAEMKAGSFINVRTTDQTFGTETYAYSLSGFTQEYAAMKSDKDCGF